jgi:hypothetical protein
LIAVREKPEKTAVRVGFLAGVAVEAPAVAD